MATVNEQQKYLLGRLPGRYDLKDIDVLESAEVKAARKTIESAQKIIGAHDKQASKQRCDYQNKFKKDLDAAREAIYFKKPDEALAAVKALETEFPAKCKC